LKIQNKIEKTIVKWTISHSIYWLHTY